VHVGQVQVILLGGSVVTGVEEEDGDRRVVDGGVEGVGVGVRAEDCDAVMYVVGLSSCVVGKEKESNESGVRSKPLLESNGKSLHASGK
jgi:hypothetical protein